MASGRRLGRVPRTSASLALLRAAHPGPTVAVTVLTALLAVAAGHGVRTGAVVTAAVGMGQLTIGWSNDLIDASRDREVGRRDKPVALGEVTRSAVRRALLVAGALCLALSALCGAASGLVHVLLGVGSGWAYNLGVKSSRWSPLPYAVAFGTLPAVVSLALPTPRLPPTWMMAAGALLGVGAHLLNALPDLADDEQTGVRGLPHRLGGATVRWLAPLVLTLASVITAFGPPTGAGGWVWAGFLTCVALAGVAVVTRGRTPFLAAVGIAMVDVVSLVLRG
jgi:4-hydroxybenzoate polyprenyltransferase